MFLLFHLYFFLVVSLGAQTGIPVSKTLWIRPWLIVLPFYGHDHTRKLQKSLTSLLSYSYPQVALKMVFQTTCRIKNLFNFKDIMPKRLKSMVVYRVHCTNCDATYMGKTKRHMETRLKEHRDPRKPTAVTDHMLRNSHDVTMDDVRFWCNGKKWQRTFD